MNDSKTEKTKPKMDLSSLKALASKDRQYLWLILGLFFIVLYGYLLLKINGFNQAKPSPFQVSNDLKTTTLPAINQKMVNQFEQLKDNSVSVQSIFNNQRSNPFQ